jgi:hypothetical protein
MAERKNTEFDRPGGYAMPTGATLSYLFLASRDTLRRRYGS